MAESIIIALIIAKIKGFKIKRLFKIKEFYLILFMELLVLYVQFNIYRENYWVIKYTGIFKSIYLLSYLPLIYKLSIYKEALIGSGFVFLGSIFNNIVIKANGGFMPVYPTLSKITGYYKEQAFEKVNDIHILLGGSSKLWYLSDIFDLGYSVLSIGDILIRIFVVIIIYSSIKYLNNNSVVGDEKTC